MQSTRIFRRSRSRYRRSMGVQQPFFQSMKSEQEYDSEGQSFFSPAVADHQSALTIGAHDDAYEQEANQVAEQVVHHSSAEVNSTASSPSVQTMCAECAEEPAIQRMAEEEEPSIQRMTEEEEPAIQREMMEEEPAIMRMAEEEEPARSNTPIMRQAMNGQGVGTPQLANQLYHSKGGGSPLAETTQQDMGHAFGRDFSHIRIHTDANAVQMSQGLSAKAFTHGADIYFNQGQYAPESTAGKRLLAHELTHTIQQGATGEPAKRPAKSRGVPKKSSCCTQSEAKGLDDGDVAGVICCNKKKYACVWISGGATGATNAKAVKIIDHCSKVHEKAHFDDVKCPTGKGPTRPPFRAGKDPAAEEKKSYRREARCLKRRKWRCGKDAECKKQVKAELDHVKAQF